jgi:hypothetical protein
MVLPPGIVTALTQWASSFQILHVFEPLFGAAFYCGGWSLTQLYKRVNLLSGSIRRPVYGPLVLSVPRAAAGNDLQSNSLLNLRRFEGG